MEIEEYKARKHELEQMMAAALQDLCAQFENQSGLTPRRISVDMIEDRNVAQVSSRWIVGRVETEFEI